MSTVLSNICLLALNVEKICSRVLIVFCFIMISEIFVLFQSPPLLRSGSNQSVTMSQRQAASLLACEFFCLYPYRSDRRDEHKFGKFPKLNFDRYIYVLDFCYSLIFCQFKDYTEVDIRKKLKN
jgi:hypothetical protein